MATLQTLNNLSSALLKLHKALLDFQKEQVEKETGRSLNPYELLGAALNDEAFSWLKPLSEMLVEIDLAAENLSGETSVRLENSNSPLFDPQKIKQFWTQPPSDFHEKLILAIQEDPDVSFLFSEVRLQASQL